MSIFRKNFVVAFVGALTARIAAPLVGPVFITAINHGFRNIKNGVAHGELKGAA